MAEEKTIKTRTRATAASAGFTDEERAAMQEHARELKKAARRGTRATSENGEADVMEKIGEMSPSDRTMAERVHALIKASAPELEPRTWYGMPAYSKDGNVLCFFQAAGKFKARYATLGFNDRASLDDGNMWPVAFALTRLTETEEARIIELLRRAVG